MRVCARIRVCVDGLFQRYVPRRQDHQPRRRSGAPPHNIRYVAAVEQSPARQHNSIHYATLETDLSETENLPPGVRKPPKRRE